LEGYGYADTAIYQKTRYANTFYYFLNKINNNATHINSKQHWSRGVGHGLRTYATTTNASTGTAQAVIYPSRNQEQASGSEWEG